MKFLFYVFIFIFLSVSAAARTITVDDDGPADFNSIQAAINDSNNADTIIAQPGLYEESIHFRGKNITLTSVNPANPSIVTATTITGCVVFSGTEDANCTLAGFNIDQVIGVGPPMDSNGFPEPNYEPQSTHASISHCILMGNIVFGGTVISMCDGTISNCLIADNVPAPNVPVIGYTVEYCHGLIRNCTIVNNYWFGVGIRFLEGQTTLENCVIYSNKDHSQVTVEPGATANILYTNIQGGLGAVQCWPDSTVNWGPGNIDTDPCFVREGYWDFNEPWTLFEGDYRLQSEAGRWDPNSESWVIDANTSTCIDAGNPGCETGSEPLPNGSRINMGAFGGTPTASKSPPDWRSIADLTNDWVVDFNDLAVFVDYWLDSGNCIPADLNRSRSADFADFSIFAENWLWQ